MTDRWTDRIVGDRMTVDQQFSDRVTQSQFNRQQWGLVMTAVEFDIENPADPDRATLVADTSSLPNVIPELEHVESGPPGTSGGPTRDSGDGGGLVDTLTDALGLGGGDGDDSEGDGVDEETLNAAEQLVGEYADELQAHLEERGKWADVRAAAASQ